jgi:hypothetical protein
MSPERIIVVQGQQGPVPADVQAEILAANLSCGIVIRKAPFLDLNDYVSAEKLVDEAYDHYKKVKRAVKRHGIKYLQMPKRFLVYKPQWDAFRAREWLAEVPKCTLEDFSIEELDAALVDAQCDAELLAKLRHQRDRPSEPMP